MPKETIILSLIDKYSPTIKSMSNVTKTFNKLLEEEHKKLEEVTKASKKSENGILQIVKAIRMLEQPPVAMEPPETTMLDDGKTKSIDTMLSVGNILLATGAADIVRELVANNAEYHIGSNFGSEGSIVAGSAGEGAVVGTVAGSVMGMKIGATLGSAVPLLGTAIGAAVGGALGIVLGGINGCLENMANRDDTFKDVVKSQFDKVISQQQEDIQTGSQLAAAQETDSMVPWRVPTDSFAGLTQQIADLEQSQQIAMGDGYNEKRKEGLEKQANWMSGEQGEKMSQANKLIGEYQASLDNERESILRENQDDALRQIEEKGLTGAEAGRVLMEAQVKAENDYRMGNGYQLQLQTQKTMLGNMRAELSHGWGNFGFTMGQEFSLGLERGLSDAKKKAIAEMLANSEGDNTINTTPASSYLYGDPVGYTGDTGYGAGITIGNAGYMGYSYAVPLGDTGYITDVYGVVPAPKAVGQSYVPFDNFPALLHQGERVLTASEARSAATSTPSVTVTGNSFIVREEADVDRIAAELLSKLQKARFTYAP